MNFADYLNKTYGVGGAPSGGSGPTTFADKLAQDYGPLESVEPAPTPAPAPSFTDRLIRAMTGAGKSYASSLANIGGVAADTAGAANDLAFGEQNNRAVEQAKQNIENYRKQLQSGQLDEAQKQLIQRRIESNQRRIDQLSHQKSAQRENADTVRDTVYRTADKLNASAGADIAEAKQGLGKLGQLAVDVGVGGAQLAGDIGLAALTGGSALAPMVARSFGGGAQEARQEGANLGQQLAYGAGSAALSAGTEKMFGGSAIMQKAFGGGKLDKLADKAFKPLANSAVGRVVKSAAEEGMEELAESAANPLLKRATYDKDAGWDGGEMMNDALVGAILGGALGGISEVGRFAPKESPAPAVPVESVAAPVERNEAPTPIDAPAENAAPVASESVPMSAVEQVVEIAKQGNLSNKYAEAIMTDPEAVAELGLDLTGLTKSQARAAIKSAIMDRAYADEAVLEDAAEPVIDEPAATPQNPLQVDEPAPVPQENMGEQGNPTPVAQPTPAPTNKGRASIAPHKKINFHYAMVDADALTTSNDVNGVVNHNYPAELQPRDRSRASLLQQMASIANDPDPEMLESNSTAQEGAPIVTADGVVIGGNGRVAGLGAAYRRGTAEEYRQYMMDNAAKWGLDPATFPERPVLVRVLDDEMNLPELASKLNEHGTAAMSATEQAIEDANRMTPEILSLLVADDENGLLGADNKAFIQAFNSKVIPASQGGSATMRGGELSNTGLNRITNAVLYYAYGDENLVEALAEDPHPDSKNIINALVATAPAAVRVRNGVDAGDLHDVGIIPTIMNAVELFRRAKAENLHALDFASQGSLLADGGGEYDYRESQIAEFLENNTRGAKQLKTLFGAMYDQVQAAGNPKQGGLFGGDDVTLDTVMEGAIRKYESDSNRKFHTEGSGEAAGEYGSGTKEKSDRSRRNSGESVPAEFGGNPEAAGRGAEADPLTKAVTMPMEKDDGFELVAEVPEEFLDDDDGGEETTEMRTIETTEESSDAGVDGAENATTTMPPLKPGQRVSNALTGSLRQDLVGGEKATGEDAQTYARRFVYDPISEGESVYKARKIVYPDGKFASGDELLHITDELKLANAWDGVMMDAAHLIQDEYRRMVVDGKMEQADYLDWIDTIRGHQTAGGQGIQAIAKHTDRGNRGGYMTEKEAWDRLKDSGLSEEEINDRFGEVLKNDERIRDIMARLEEAERRVKELEESGTGAEPVESVPGPGDGEGATDGGETTADGGAATPPAPDTAKSEAEAELDELRQKSDDELREIIMEIAESRGVLRGLTGGQSKRLTTRATKALDLMDTDTLVNMAYASSSALVSDATKADIGKKMKTIQILNMLSNPKTFMKNIAGNSTFYGLDALTMKGAALVDMAVSNVTGTRSLASGGFGFTKAEWQAINKAIQESVAEITLDIDGGEGKYGTGSKRTFKANGNFLERVGSILERNMGYALTTSDEAFKGAARTTAAKTQRLVDEGKIKTGDTEYAQQQADALAKYRTFQSDTGEGKIIPKVISTIHDFLNLAGVGDSGKRMFRTENRPNGRKVHSFGVGDLAAPFTKVAGNLASIGVDYSPINAAKGAVELINLTAKKIQNPNMQAKAVSDFARGMTGTGIALGVAELVKQGLIKRADDEDNEDVAKLNRSEGMYGTQINLDAAKRWADGKGGEWRRGDTLVDLSNLEPLNFIISLGVELTKDEDANIISRFMEGDDAEATDLDKALAPFTKSAKSAMQAAGDLPILSTVGDIAKDVFSYKKDPILSAAQALGNTAISSVTPNALYAYARGKDKKQRSTHSSDAVADVLADTFKSRIPGLRESLPTTVNILGEEAEVPGGTFERLVNAMVNPVGVNEYTQSEVSKEMERLRDKSSLENFYLTSRKPKELSYTKDGETVTKQLTYDQQQKFQTTASTQQMAVTSAIIGTSAYKSASAAEQAALLKRGKDYAYQMAKASVFGIDAADSWVRNSMTSRQDLGISQAEWLCLYDKYGEVMGGQTYASTVRMAQAGMSIPEVARMKDALRGSNKDGIVDYISANFPAEQRWGVFNAYRPDWVNPY